MQWKQVPFLSAYRVGVVQVNISDDYGLNRIFLLVLNLSRFEIARKQADARKSYVLHSAEVIWKSDHVL